MDDEQRRPFVEPFLPPLIRAEEMVHDVTVRTWTTMRDMLDASLQREHIEMAERGEFDG